MCGIFALLHKLRLTLVSDNLFLSSVMPVVYCKFVSSGRCVAYHDAVRENTRRHNHAYELYHAYVLSSKCTLENGRGRL